MPDERPVVLTCAQPTNRLTIGNYLGAIRNWTRLLDDYDCLFGVVDYHALTTPYVPAELRRNTLDCVAQYIACGLDPERATIFVQSHVRGHADLAWILGCLTPIGELQRMTQFKEKAARLGFAIGGEETAGELKFTHEGARPGASVNSGLLFYPVLMAADILLYNADVVPTGEDQKQHLELCRDVARRFNHQYSETFKIPEPMMGKAGARIMSLSMPTKKMSKSDDDAQGTLFLLDDPAVLKKKIMSAVTDSGREVRVSPDKPGITNLLGIYCAITGLETAEAEQRFEGASYGDFKDEVARQVVGCLEPVQERYRELSADKASLEKVIREGAAAAQTRANRTMSKVLRKSGLLAPGR